MQSPLPAFIADIHSRVPRLCGQPVRYSSKTFTPTVGRTPHATLSSQPTHRAHVPSHSASLGGQLVYTQQCGPHLSCGVCYLVNKSSNPGHINTALQEMNSCFNPVLVTSVSCLCALHH